MIDSIKNHINLHHSQTASAPYAQTELIKNHINLHHSQTSLGYFPR